MAADAIGPPGRIGMQAFGVGTTGVTGTPGK
jgi:hypothetical protein